MGCVRVLTRGFRTTSLGYRQERRSKGVHLTVAYRYCLLYVLNVSYCREDGPNHALRILFHDSNVHHRGQIIPYHLMKLPTFLSLCHPAVMAPHRLPQVD